MMKARLGAVLVVAGVFGGAAATTASGAVLLSNLAEPLRDASAIGNTGTLPPPPPPTVDWSWAAQAFAPDASSYDLISIEAIVGDGSLAPTPVVVAELRSDAGGPTGGLVTTFTAPGMSGPLGVRTFLPDNPVTLLANTTYWFVLGTQNPGTGTYFWGYAQGNGATGPGSFLNYNYSYDSDATWLNFGSDNPFFLQVNVTAVPGVPEPGGLLLFGGGLVAIAVRRRQSSV